MRATLRPSELSDRHGQYVAVGGSGPSYVLDAEGRTVAVRPDEPRSGTLHTTCGGSIVAERRQKQVALVDISSLDDVEIIEFGRASKSLLCEGGDVFAVAGPKGERRIYDVRTGEPVTPEVVNAFHVALIDGNLIYRAEPDDSHPEGWRTTSLTAGTERFIAEIPRAGKRMESVDFSPDGQRIALTLAEGNQPVLDLMLVSVADGVTVTRSIDTHVASVRWLDNDRLFVSTDSGGYPDTVDAFIASGADLTTLVQFDSELWWPTHLEDDRPVGLDGGSFRTMGLDGGASDVLNELPASRRLLRLPEPVTVTVTTTGSAGRESIDTPIPSRRIEAIVSTTSIPEDDDVAQRSSPAGTESRAERNITELATGSASPANDTGVTTTVVAMAATLLAVGVGGLIVQHRRKSHR